ncbi:MAG: hypothetical protein ACFFCW_38765 [Candidatus Hodarchaeota archaeon]
MTRVQKLLGEPQIAKFIETHQTAAGRITKAAELLVEHHDAVRSLQKLLPALSEKEIYVFFSYKAKDALTAKAVVDVLRKNSAGKLKITYQGEFTEEYVGKRWRGKIREEVHRANWFILLLPDPSDDWDWCLFETGLFEAQLTSADRLICLHHPDVKIPNPIEGYQAVSATIPEVENFLKMVFLNDNPVYGLEALNNSLEEEELKKVAKIIVEAIRPPRKMGLVLQAYEPWVELKVEDPSGLQDKDDLDRAIVQNANNQALDLFDFDLKPATWGELRSGLPEQKEDDRWREELFRVIRKIAGGRKFTPIQAVFQTSDNRLFRPVTCAVDRVGSIAGPIAIFHITFSEEVAAVDASSVPKDISVLAIFLRYAFRFRWELLEKFGTKPMSEDDVERLHNSLERIRADAASRGIESIEPLLALFPAEQANKISEMNRNWYQIRNPQGTGELDIAIKNKEAEKIPEILARFIPASQEFLVLAANRFSELLTKIDRNDSTSPH